MTQLAQLDQTEPAHGGKAAGLRRLISLGLRVPLGIACDADAVGSLLKGDGDAVTALTRWLADRTTLLAVRSSALNEDGEDRSFAGIYETELCVRPQLDSVLAAIRKVAASGQSARAESYGGHVVDIVPVIIQELIEAEISGVLYSHAVDTDGLDVAYAEWVRGAGDKLVNGEVTPASIRVPRDATASVGALRKVVAAGGTPPQGTVEAIIDVMSKLPKTRNTRGWDVEWAIDSNGVFWSLQLRPMTSVLAVGGESSANGALPAAPGIAAGKVRLVREAEHDKVTLGDILVARITEIDFVPAMRRAAAIVTEEGGLLSHAATVAREFGKPCVVGLSGALDFLVEGEIAEVDGNQGTVRQRNSVFGGPVGPELDWASVYLYDRGVELADGPTPYYLDATPYGLTAYIDDGIAPAAHQELMIELRRRYSHDIPIRQGDRRIWHREWRRFNQLSVVGLLESQLKCGIANWDVDFLNRSISLLWKMALQIRQMPHDTAIELLFSSELGAALHSLVSVTSEGHGIWSFFRDSSTWRFTHKVRFGEFLNEAHRSDSLVEERLTRASQCIRVLGELRNAAYPFFSENELFDSNYFPGRAGLVEAACDEEEISFEDENQGLNCIYESASFKRLDCLAMGHMVALMTDR